MLRKIVHTRAVANFMGLADLISRRTFQQARRPRCQHRLVHRLQGPPSSWSALSWLRPACVRCLATISHTDARVQAFAARARTQLAELEQASKTGAAHRIKAHSMEAGQLAEIVSLVEQLAAVEEERHQLAQLLADPQLREMAEQDDQLLTEQLHTLQASLASALAGPAPEEECGAVLEITAGVGGQEAMLFASELLDMYTGYCRLHDWRMEVASLDTTELGGVRSAAASVHGAAAYGRLRHEAGVHRVQRVPRTERTGRLHTSTATVAVLPLPGALHVPLPAAQLRIETKKASGAGGQHVNTTDSAVRVTHIPTGTMVECQQMRSQHRNRERALELLRARLYHAQLERAERERRATRRSQVGDAGRAQKVRTYNYPQDRVTDHRCGLSVRGLQLVLSGQKLDVLVDELCAWALQRRAEAALEEGLS